MRRLEIVPYAAAPSLKGMRFYMTESHTHTPASSEQNAVITSSTSQSPVSEEVIEQASTPNPGFQAVPPQGHDMPNIQISSVAQRIPNSLLAPVLTDNGGPIFPPADERFNWGAFLLTWLHALCHRQYMMALALFVVPMVVSFLGFIPYVGIVFSILSWVVTIALMVLYGKIGYRAACLGKEYQSAAELYQRERKYLWIGIALIVASIVFAVMAVILLALLFANMGNQM